MYLQIKLTLVEHMITKPVKQTSELLSTIFPVYCGTRISLMVFSLCETCSFLIFSKCLHRRKAHKSVVPLMKILEYFLYKTSFKAIRL